MPLAMDVHREPSKWMIVPVSPTAYTSLGALPHTLRRNRVVGLVTDDTASPLARRIVPSAPTM